MYIQYTHVYFIIYIYYKISYINMYISVVQLSALRMLFAFEVLVLVIFLI